MKKIAIMLELEKKNNFQHLVLKTVDDNPLDFKVIAFIANYGSVELEALVRKYAPKYVYIENTEDAYSFKRTMADFLDFELYTGAKLEQFRKLLRKENATIIEDNGFVNLEREDIKEYLYHVNNVVA